MAVTSSTGGGAPGEIMLFGVRVVIDSMRKSVSLNNLSQYEHRQESNNNSNNNKDGSNSHKDDSMAVGYASADDAVPHSSGSRGERKRGVPWTEEEHKLFLLGLQKVGKGDWRGISRNFVKTRTPTQVASHAQKYFLRRSNLNRRRRRSSLFDITTDTFSAISMEEEQAYRQESPNNSASRSLPLLPALPQTSDLGNFHAIPTFPTTTNSVVLGVPIESPMQSRSLEQDSQVIDPSNNIVRPVPVFSATRAPTIPDLNLNFNSDPSPLSLQLSDQRESSSRHSAFQVTSRFKDGDNIITVA